MAADVCKLTAFLSDVEAKIQIVCKIFVQAIWSAPSVPSLQMRVQSPVEATKLHPVFCADLIFFFVLTFCPYCYNSSGVVAQWKAL
jgi:hypothetical protein